MKYKQLQTNTNKIILLCIEMKNDKKTFINFISHNQKKKYKYA